MTLTTLAEVLALLNDAKKISAATVTTTLPQTTSYPVALEGDTTARRITHATLRGGEFNIRDYGADPAASPAINTAAIQAAINAAGAVHGEVYVPHGIYPTSAELSLAGLSGVSIRGASSVGSQIQFVAPTPGSRSALSLVGAKNVSVSHLSLYSANPGGLPDTVLAMGRSDAGSYGQHKFNDVAVLGYCAKALVYNVASEVNQFTGCAFILYGGGAKYPVYISQVDDLGIGGFTASTCLSNWFSNCYFWNTVSPAGASAIYIYGRSSTGDITVRDSFMAVAGAGRAITIYAENSAHGPFVFDAIRAEGEPGGTFLHLESIDGDSEVGRLSVTHCNWAGSGLAYMYYSVDRTRWVEGHIFGNVTNAPLSSLSDIIHCVVYEFNHLFTVRNTTYGCFIVCAAAYPITVGGWSKYNVIIRDGVMTTPPGFGTSALATTLGSVTRKLEVFDTSGNSLGFVPIYGSIS